MVPLYGHPRYFRDRHRLLHLKDRILVAIDVGNDVMERFACELEEEGWRVFRARLVAPVPPRLLQAVLAAGTVTTTYVIRMDADTYVGDDLRNAVAAAKRDGADLCSVKVHVRNRRKRVVCKLQALEYDMAMLSRHFRPWLTSGACFIGRTDSLRLAYEHHSLWTPGEDIETGRVARALRMTIRHVDWTVSTEVPPTVGKLFRQRRLWWAGMFRHWFVNVDRNIVHMPVLTGYYALALWFSIYFRWWNFIDLRGLVYELPLLLVTYVVVTAVSNLQVLSPWMIVYPLYAMVQALVMPAVGSCYYLVLLRRRGRLGRYRFGYRRRRPTTDPAHAG